MPDGELELRDSFKIKPAKNTLRKDQEKKKKKEKTRKKITCWQRNDKDTQLSWSKLQVEKNFFPDIVKAFPCEGLGIECILPE